MGTHSARPLRLYISYSFRLRVTHPLLGLVCGVHWTQAKLVATSLLHCWLAPVLHSWLVDILLWQPPLLRCSSYIGLHVVACRHRVSEAGLSRAHRRTSIRPGTSLEHVPKVEMSTLSNPVPLPPAKFPATIAARIARRLPGAGPCVPRERGVLIDTTRNQNMSQVIENKGDEVSLIDTNSDPARVGISSYQREPRDLS